MCSIDVSTINQLRPEEDPVIKHMRSVGLIFFDTSVCTVVSDITIIVGSLVRKVHALDTAVPVTACFYAQLLRCFIDFVSKRIAEFK